MPPPRVAKVNTHLFQVWLICLQHLIFLDFIVFDMFLTGRVIIVKITPRQGGKDKVSHIFMNSHKILPG